jgi:methionyl-tRNA formyltransferase
MKIVFMGTPDFAVASLRALVDAGHDLAAVVTRADKPAGRGQAVRASAVKRFAVARDLPVEQPEKLRDPATLARLAAFSPELIVVAAYGKILPRSVLDLPPRGAINVHASLLPKYRGAAPIQRCLLGGDPVTGVTIMQMNERMDAGDILLQRETKVADDDTTATLQARLAELGAEALVEALELLREERLHPTPQREEEATLAPMIRREEGAIDWRRPAVEIERAVRAFDPWPGAYTGLRGKLLKIHRAAVDPRTATAAPGSVIEAADRIRVATGAGSLEILELQPEGRRRMTARELIAGRGIVAGDELGGLNCERRSP